MQISKSIKRLIYWELGVPITLLSIGIYHGLMQTIYRSGAIHESSVAKLDYYQGLTLHGVINALVLTTFFAVAFGHATMAFYVKKEPNKKLGWLSFWLMRISLRSKRVYNYFCLHVLMSHTAVFVAGNFINSGLVEFYR